MDPVKPQLNFSPNQGIDKTSGLAKKSILYFDKANSMLAMNNQ